jgi:hypothetical protein
MSIQGDTSRRTLHKRSIRIHSRVIWVSERNFSKYKLMRMCRFQISHDGRNICCSLDVWHTNVRVELEEACRKSTTWAYDCKRRTVVQAHNRKSSGYATMGNMENRRGITGLLPISTYNRTKEEISFQEKWKFLFPHRSTDSSESWNGTCWWQWLWVALWLTKGKVDGRMLWHKVQVHYLW